LKNYLKIAIRNLLRYKAYSYINIFGLAIGVACCLLILLYINDEISYDSFHNKAGRIFRINSETKYGGFELDIPLTSDEMGSILKREYPQVEEYTRIFTFSGSRMIKKGENYNKEERIAFVDSTFFNVFSFKAVSGSINNVLNEPNTVVITKSIAEKYFGTTGSAGKYIETNENGSTRYKVAAVIEDMPSNSHFRFDFLFSMLNANYCCWGNHVATNMLTYLVLKEGVNYKQFEKNFSVYNDKYTFPFMKRLLGIQSKEDYIKAGNSKKNTLTPLSDIHLYSDRAYEISPGGTIQYVYIFSAVALFILLIACINFMNLTTARSANRAKEVGIRKVLGTVKKNLIVQFLSESVLISFISVILAVILVYHALPYFNNLAGKELGRESLSSPAILIFLIVLPFVIGLLAGSYPALFLSRFLPVEVMKGNLSRGSKSGGIRNALVVFQFASSVILITATIVVYMQLNYIQNKNLGYQKEQVLIIDDTYNLGNNADAFKNEMLNVPGVINGTMTSFLPVSSVRSYTGFVKDLSQTSSTGIAMQNWPIDYDYMKTMGLQIAKGRIFSKDFGTDSSAIILNEKAVKQLGYGDNPVGQKIYRLAESGNYTEYNIIGVVKDFHYESLRQNIESLCFILGKNTGAVSFKINAANVTGILKEAETKWKTLASGLPFNYRFMDESFDEMYRAEQRIGIIALSFSVLAIIVACLGLFGLATFLAEQRTKEIGVRKVLGASILSIIIMLSKEFIKWVVIANIIAWPLAYYFMNKWLQDFAYRIYISWWFFIAAGSIALIIALLTVSFQAFKAATANPVNSLKYE
ncbi:MAG: ABC transporter permease, partial [Ignavibacteriaceae bacterium]